MREIKFRAWHAGHKHADLQMLYDEKPGDCLVWKSQGQNIIQVMQYTGLQDKNDREIFEGDIYKVWLPGMPNEYRAIQVVQFLRGYFGCAGYPLYLMDNSTLEVIGNIYENPELLP